MTYFIVKQPPTTAAKEIYTATGGKGYAGNQEIHLISPQMHYVYKFNGDPIGWYAHNDKTDTDYYLGDGASPTIEANNIEIFDEDYFFNKLTLIPFKPEGVALKSSIKELFD